MYILLLLGTGMLFTLLTSLSLLSRHVQYCHILKDSKDIKQTLRTLSCHENVWSSINKMYLTDCVELAISTISMDQHTI